MRRSQIKGRLRLNDGERQALAEMGQKLGKHALAEIATIVKPDTMLGWHRKCVAQKCDGSTQRTAPGRPMTDHEVEALVVRMAREHRSWGYDRLVGALANLGDTVRAQTVGTILKRHGIAPAPERKTTTWKEFIRTHLAVGAINHRGVARADDPVWGSVAPPCADAGCTTFASRAASSG